MPSPRLDKRISSAVHLCRREGWTMRRRLSVTLRSDGKGDLQSIPKHLWCLMAQYMDIADSISTLQCNSWLWDIIDQPTIWQRHCFVAGFSRAASGAILSLERRRDPDIAWRYLIQLNVQKKDRPGVWVSVGNVEVYVPLTRCAALGDRQAVMCELQQIAQVGCAAGSPQRMLGRLRHVQWKGRPGVLVEEMESIAGHHLLLEMPLGPLEGASESEMTWPLPPGSWADSPARELPGARRSSKRELSPRLASKMLLRVVSPLLRKDLWLEIFRYGVWLHLCHEIVGALRRNCVLLADVNRPIEVELMEVDGLQKNKDVKPSTLLRDLFWTDSETVYIDLAQDLAAASRCKTPRSDRSGDKVVPLVLRLRREEALSARGEDACQDPSLLLDDSGVPEPVLAVNAAAASAESTALSMSTIFGRQVSDSMLQQSEINNQLSTFSRLQTAPARPQAIWHPGDLQSLDVSDASSTTSSSASLNCVGSPLQSPRTRRQQQRSSSSPRPPTIGDEDRVVGTVTDSRTERIVPHYQPVLLPQTCRARQFEFHPALPNVLLTGDRKGSVNVVDMEEQGEALRPPLVVGSCPLLALVWMRHHPQTAVCGVSQSGKIMFLKYDPHARISKPALQRVHTSEEFPRLSSLSANCTDDFLLASGIVPNIAVYDVHTGKVLTQAQGVHESFINISRFSNNSPHIFATASFDNTCKVWDLRQPLLRDRPMKVLNTGFHNVMCVFSPDDRHLLCSGVDTRIAQFEVPTWRQTPGSFELREPVHQDRYRRSTYLANGQYIVTAATEESHLHLLTADGHKAGVVDFRGVVQRWTKKAALSAAQARFEGSTGPTLQRRMRSCPFGTLLDWAGSWQKPKAVKSSTCTATKSAAGGAQHLIQGSVHLDDADLDSGSTRRHHEFVQSIRTHPQIATRIGVLLSFAEGEQSYVSVVDIDPKRAW
eukprot:TRINITY_DN16422_c0_g1_i1.p1 TRINITY_DN16422_c0_g1~~TRINITY_DN16422_c0_g1_i1.p1  ORF type:complete len:939 (+),score=103.11 TRINITY_DN16422_c0_g1_i1:83-2899(+)